MQIYYVKHNNKNHNIISMTRSVRWRKIHIKLKPYSGQLYVSRCVDLGFKRKKFTPPISLSCLQPYLMLSCNFHYLTCVGKSSTVLRSMLLVPKAIASRGRHTGLSRKDPWCTHDNKILQLFMTTLPPFSF